MHNLLGLNHEQSADMRHKAAGTSKLKLPTPSCTEQCSPTAGPELEVSSMKSCFLNHQETGNLQTGATTIREHTDLQPPEVLIEDNG